MCKYIEFWIHGMLGHAYYALYIQELLYDKSFKLSEVLLEGVRGHHSYFQDSATSLISNQSLSVFGPCNQCSVGICYFRRGHVLSQGGNCVTQQNYWWLSHWVIFIEVVPTGTMSSPLIRIHPTRNVVCPSNISYKCFFLLYVVFNVQDVLYLRTVYFSWELEKQSLYLLLSCFENKIFWCHCRHWVFYRIWKKRRWINQTLSDGKAHRNSTLQQRLEERFSWGHCVCVGGENSH